MEITAERLRELLRYEPETGEWTWLVQRPHICIGDIAGYQRKDGAYQIKIYGVAYLSHRLAFLYINGEWPINDIDHINMNKGDNRWCNLRPCNDSMNKANQHAYATNLSTRLKGSYFHKRTGKYSSSICVNYKQHYLGLYDTPEAAHEAYAEAAKMFFGKFARAN